MVKLTIVLTIPTCSWEPDYCGEGMKKGKKNRYLYKENLGQMALACSSGVGQLLEQFGI